MKALIIDDENKARILLQSLLETYCPEITSILQAKNLEDGVAILKTNGVDIVYCDIKMPKYSGLQIIELLGTTKIDFQLIFITAYNQYAVQAFKLSAIDYLLKPIDIEEFKSATAKAISNQEKKTIASQLDDLKKAFNQLSLNKIALEVPNGVVFISHDDILLFEAEGMYTKVYLTNNKSELICKPLRHFVEQLYSLIIFYKPHRSYLINLKHIKELSRKNGLHIIMSNDKTIPISKEKRTDLNTILKEVFNT